MPLKLTRRKGSSHWYIRGTVRGEAIFETTGVEEAKAAETIRIRREGELLQRSIFGVGATLTFLEAAVAYIDDGGEDRFLGELDEATGKWTLLIGHFASVPVHKIGQDEIDAAAKKLYPDAANATRKRQVYVPMAAVLHHAERKTKVPVPKLHHPRVPKAETKWSTPDRFAKLLQHCSPKIRRLVIFLAYTGGRISELLRVDWERDVFLSQRIVFLRRTKNGKPRPVHIPDPLLIELASVPEGERHGRVLPWWRARQAVYKPLRRACRLAGVEYLPTHQQGRHTYGTWMRQFGGLDLKGLMDAGGWDSLQSVERYAHVVPGEAARAADRMPGIGADDVQIACSPDEILPKQLTAKRKSR